MSAAIAERDQTIDWTGNRLQSRALEIGVHKSRSDEVFMVLGQGCDEGGIEAEMTQIPAEIVRTAPKNRILPIEQDRLTILGKLRNMPDDLKHKITDAEYAGQAGQISGSQVGDVEQWLSHRLPLPDISLASCALSKPPSIKPANIAHMRKGLGGKRGPTARSLEAI